VATLLTDSLSLSGYLCGGSISSKPVTDCGVYDQTWFLVVSLVLLSLIFLLGIAWCVLKRSRTISEKVRWERWKDWQLATLVVVLVGFLIILLIHALAPQLTERVSCSTEDCILLPPAQMSGENFTAPNSTQGRVGSAPPIAMNSTWNATHIILKTGCGSSFYNAPLNVTYTVAPIYQLNCKSVIASVLERLTSGYVRWCQGSKSMTPDKDPGALGIYTD